MVWSKGKLGSAYYDTETSQIYLQMDVVETKDFQFLKRGKLTVTHVTEDFLVVQELAGANLLF